MAGKKQLPYDDYALARGRDNMTAIAERYGMSVSMVYHISRGESRPELKEQIDQLINDYMAEARRVLRSRGRFFAARLIALAEQSENLAVARDSVELGLKIGGVITADMAPQERASTINLILSAEDGARSGYLRKKLTGVVNTNAVLDMDPVEAKTESQVGDNGESGGEA